MGLTGVDPFDPIPSTRRELIFGAGPGSTGIFRDVVLLGNKTSAGSETVDTIGVAIADDLDCRTRFGIRSEVYSMYRQYVRVDSGATIFGVAVTEAAGSASTVDLDIEGVSDFNSTVQIPIGGVNVFYSILDGDDQQTTAEGIRDAINDADEGRLIVTATAALNGGGPGWNTVITASQLGIRGDFIIGDTVSRGIRVSITTNGGTNAQTVVKSTFTAGAGEDDGTAAIAVLAPKDNIYFHVSPWHTTNGVGSGIGSAVALSTTDNQLGELQDMIRTQNLPINSKEKVVVYGLVGTNAQAISIPTDADMNSVRGYGFWAENNDLTPAMLASVHAAVVRANVIAHPGANISGYTQGDNTPYPIPEPFVSTDVPTTTEIRTALNNGVSPVTFGENGRPSLVRWITNRSENSSGAKDYKAREGHITTAIDFVWNEIKTKWEAQKQAFVANDPLEGELPILNTSTPRTLQKLIFGVIDDMTGSKPLGLFDGPILSPDQNQFMKDNTVVSKITAGLTVNAQFIVVEHLLKFEGKFLEVGEAY